MRAFQTARHRAGPRRCTRLVVAVLAARTAAWTAACTVACTGAPDRPSDTGPAYTNLYEALGRPAGLRLEGDSAVIVTRMVTRDMRTMSRQVAARALARTVERNWPAGRLVLVTVVFREATRLGPFIVRTRDDSVRVSDATDRDTSGVPPARLP